jgi:integrase
MRDAFKASLSEGVDPRAPSSAAAVPSLEQVARSWFKANKAKWKPSYSSRFWVLIEKDILNHIGKEPISAIEPPMVLERLRAIEDRGAIYTAKRARQMLSTIYKFAIAEGTVRFNPAADVGVALKPLPKEVHRSAIREPELPAFFRKLRNYDGERLTALAIELVVHTFLRTKEMRFARWDEFEDDLWRIPAERMKMGKEHLVPLSPESKRILGQIKDEGRGSEWVFPGERGIKPISENTMLFGIYRLGYHSRATVHGFRSTASTILNESGLWRADAIERQLAHVPKNEVRSAYNAALYLDERREMMNFYSALLAKAAQTPDLPDLV